MQPIFSMLTNAFRQVLVILLIGFISLSSLFVVSTQASFAATPNQKLIQQENLDKQSQSASDREQAYEEQIKAAEDPDKVFSENLKEYRKENPGENVLEKAAEGAEKIVEKVTGK
ncbi:hypothetical protein [Aliterella atlantica]|uniref:Uncharacterized protein n=1 Tax=Aliterella atlantica CENA595 TaxID=1618023 RepID=A0A0D8ZXH4_9CYAN|nr:hypothetical protein [Aliterella atlantica]KJH71911.1 hypothetical protein UH38_09255 [Aliterella atlantica CENA595]